MRACLACDAWSGCSLSWSSSTPTHPSPVPVDQTIDEQAASGDAYKEKPSNELGRGDACLAWTRLVRLAWLFALRHDPRRLDARIRSPNGDVALRNAGHWLAVFQSP